MTGMMQGTQMGHSAVRFRFRFRWRASGFPMDHLESKSIAPLAAVMCLALVIGFIRPAFAAGSPPAMITPGQFNVGATGAFTYTIPIAVPPGTAGMVPSLSLDYSSQNGDGLEGLGWSLNGLPSVTRCPQTFAQDDVHGGINFDANDRFCMEGQRLVPLSSCGMSCTQYGTEVEGFSRIYAYGTAGTGPAYFKVWTKSGQVMEFGNTPDSQILPVKADGTGTLPSVRLWAVNKVGDTKGNYLTVTYTDDTTNGEVYPTRIDYTGNAAAGLATYSSIQFTYIARSDITPSFLAGTIQKTTVLLSHIKTYAGASVVSDYQLNYALATAGTQHDELTSVKLCDGAGVCLKPTTFGWQGSKNFLTMTAVPNGIVQGKKIKYGNGTFYTNPNMHAVDFNGDGLTDLLSELANISISCPSSGEVYLFNSSSGSLVSANATATYIAPSPPYVNGPFCIFGDPSALIPTNALIDLNADGIMDVASDTLTPYRLMMNNELGTQFNQIVGPGEPPVYVGDFNGDGIDDFNSDRDTYNFLGNGDGTFANTSMPSINPYKFLSVADFNGDGCADWLSQGSGSGQSAIIFSPYCATSSTRFSTPYWNPSNWSVAIGDFNGDGIADILAANATSGTLYLSDGLALVAQSFTVPAGWGKYEIVTGDWNDDGKTDIALIADGSSGHYGSGHDHIILLSTGTGFVQATDPSGNPVRITNTSSTVGVGLGDFNNDGAADLWLQIASGDTQYLFSYVPEMISSVDNGAGIKTTISYDRLNKNQPLYQKCSNGTFNCGDVYPVQGVDGPLYVVSRIDSGNGLGVCAPPSPTNCYSSTYSYEGAKTDLSGRGFIGFAQMSVTDLQTHIVQTTNYETQFPLLGLTISQTKVCPAGVCAASAITLNSIANTYDVKNLGTGTGGVVVRDFVGLHQSVVTSNDADGTAFPSAATVYTYDCDTGTTSICAGATPTGFGNATTIVQTITYGGSTASIKTTSNTYSNDAVNWYLGRLTAANVQSVVGTSNLTRQTSYGYDLASGLLTSEIVEPESSSDPTLKLETDYGYDAFGNKTGATTKGCVWISSTNCSTTTGTATRATTTLYDAVTYHGQFATKITNALSQSETWAYAATNNVAFGLPSSHTGPNGLTTSWSYDTFGRKTLETRPDGNKTVVAYTYCTGLPAGESCPANAQFDTIVTPENSSGVQNGPISVTYYDGLSRAIAVDGEGFDATGTSCATTACWIRVATLYDANGRVAQTTRPYFLASITTTTCNASGGPKCTTFLYDTLGRVIEADYPDSSKATYDFEGLITSVTNNLSQTTTTIKSPQGLIASVTDANNKTTGYGYDAFGDLVLLTDPSSNQTTTSYDIRGRKTESCDPDMGCWIYKYDGFGELYSQTDAKAQITTLTYDALGRVLTRTEPDLVSTWTYDTATHGIGQLASATTAAGYSRVYTYDTLSRPSTVTLTEDGTANVYQTNYNADGRLSTETYPSGFAASFVYTALGYQYQVKDYALGTVFWTAKTRDAELHLLTQTTGNGITTTDGFDPLTGRITSIQAGTGNTVANQTYSYDTLGNLTNRTWLSNAGASVKENACYDNLNRLTSSWVTPGTLCFGGGAVGVGYDALGNITEKLDVCITTNCMTYGAGTAGPHAITAITGIYMGLTNPVIAYDTNGNMTCVSTASGCTGTVARTATWTSFNMAATITEGANSASFTYDSEHGRIKQVTTGASAGTTYYLNDPVSGAMAESFVQGGLTTWRDYIMADGHMVALRTAGPATGAPQWGIATWGSFTWTASATPSILYFTLDHLGSISVITDSTGTVVERDSYDAWGKRRNADGTASNCGTVASATTRGFTGQEMMDGLCTINFNARIYDPALGRFMTPDPTTETVYDLQILNRYSYVGNNPLSLTDPTGLCFLGCFWHGGIGQALLDIVIATVLNEFALPALESFSTATAAANAGFGAINAGISGGLAGFITTGKIQNGLAGALQAEYFFGAGNILQSDPGIIFGSPTVSTFVVHGFVGGLTTAMSGGKIASGFLAAGVASLADAPQLESNSLALNVAEHAVLGGAGSILGGGKFANGAITGAFGYLFNYEIHKGQYVDSYACAKTGDCTVKQEATPGQAVGETAAVGGSIVGGILGGPSLFAAISAGLDYLFTGETWVTVGRWMSQDELAEMQETGRMVESAKNGAVSSVAFPSNSAAFLNAPAEDVYVEFDIPDASLNARGGGWGKVWGPNSIPGQAKGITEMPPVRNINVTGN